QGGCLSPGHYRLRVEIPKSPFQADLMRCDEAIVDGAVGGSGTAPQETFFVAALYQDFLNRSSTAAEREAWLTVLHTSGPAAVVTGILHSTEALARQVDSLYAQFLGRPASGAEETTWVSFWSQPGHTEEQVAAGILSSPEFAAHLASLVPATGSPNRDY